MIGRLIALALVVSLWPGLALAQSKALADLSREFVRLYQERNFEAAEPVGLEAMKRGEAELGADHDVVASLAGNLAALYRSQGRFEKAEPLYQQALKIREKIHGPDHPEVTRILNNLTAVYRAQGRIEEAEALQKRALAASGDASGDAAGTGGSEAGTTLDNQALLNYDQGRYAEAEKLYKQALALKERELGADHPGVARTLNNLALLYEAQARYREAEPLYQRALAVRETAFGPEHPNVAATLGNLALLFRAQGRLKEAEPLAKRAVAIAERSLGPEHPDTATTVNNLALIYRAQGRLKEAEPLFKRALEIKRKALGPGHPDVGLMLNNLALLTANQGRHAEAETLYKEALAVSEKALGPEHPSVATKLYNLALLHRNQGRFEQGLSLVRRATAIHRQRTARARGQRTSGGESEQQSVRFVFLGHLQLANDVAKRTPAKRGKLVAESFEVAQLARVTAASKAVSGMAARFAAGGDDLAKLVRKRQNTLERWQRLDDQIVRDSARPSDQRNPDAEQKLRAELQQLDRAIIELDRQIEAGFPKYGEISNPRPLTLAKAQALLAKDEALISYAVWNNLSFLLVVRPNQSAMHEVPVSAKQLRNSVARLRGTLSPEGLHGLDDLLERGYAAKDAADLYRQFVAPALPLLKGVRHIFIVPDDALQSLPFSVLLTDSPSGTFGDFSDYRSAPWLARRYALTTLPSVSSLRALRSFAKPTKAKKPFAGFGDPALEGRPGGQRGISAAQLFRGGDGADMEAIRQLSPLPETAQELEAIAQTLGAGEGSYFLRANFTESLVRDFDLSDYRVVSFATHGLLAGDLEGVAEPALVLSPPKQASAQDDGLLTASEIARDLSLDADWVILSACNTAGGDAPGAEGLSGLAKAFFYAGSRALLVSHWPVASNAAVKLTTGLFAAAAAEPGLGRAEALRRSMLALLEDPEGEYFAHPLFWAPFVVVGEGGSTAK